MSMIFPGMDPYLEDPLIWQGFHNRFVIYLSDHLQPVIWPRYVAAVEERVFVEGPDRNIVPDVWLKRELPRRNAGGVALVEPENAVELQVPGLEIHESYVAILDRQSGQRVVTVIELLSPTNKFPGAGRTMYLDKQQQVRASDTHLVEIDLLRTGTHALAVPEWAARRQGDYDYLVCVNRAVEMRDKYKLYFRTFRQRLPRIGIPLADGDPDVPLDLQAVLEQTFEAGRYYGRLDYDAPCLPPLTPEDQAWANQLSQDARRTAAEVRP